MVPVWHLLLAQPHTDLEYPQHSSGFHSPSRGSSSKLSFVFVTQVKCNLFETGNRQRQLVIWQEDLCHGSQRRLEGSL